MKAATSVWSCMESVNARSWSNISTYLYICIICFLSAPTPLLFYQKQKPLCSVETNQGWAQFCLNQTLATSFCSFLFSGRGSAICTTSESSIVAEVWSFCKASSLPNGEAYHHSISEPLHLSNCPFKAVKMESNLCGMILLFFSSCTQSHFLPVWLEDEDMDWTNQKIEELPLYYVPFCWHTFSIDKYVISKISLLPQQSWNMWTIVWIIDSSLSFVSLFVAQMGF